MQRKERNRKGEGAHHASALAAERARYSGGHARGALLRAAPLDEGLRVWRRQLLQPAEHPNAAALGLCAVASRESRSG
jgi:hypothetical protein